MAATGDDYSYEECLNKIRRLKKGNEILKENLKKIHNFQSQTRTFRKMLSDNAAAINVNDFPTLDTMDSIDRFVMEELEVLSASLAGIEDKMDSLENAHDLWLRDKYYVCNLVDEIRNIQNPMNLKIKDFDNNTDIKSFMEMLESKIKEW